MGKSIPDFLKSVSADACVCGEQCDKDTRKLHRLMHKALKQDLELWQDRLEADPDLLDAVNQAVSVASHLDSELGNNEERDVAMTAIVIAAVIVNYQESH